MQLKVDYQNVREFCVLQEAVNNCRPGSTIVARFDLWNRAIELFPEVADGSWSLTFPTAVSALLTKTAAAEESGSAG